MEATNSGTQIDFGHWVLRLIALIIDGIILGIVAAILFFVIFIPLVFVGALGTFYANWGTIFLWPIIIGILMVLYFLVLDVAWGGTLGKRVLGLRVQTVNGGRINYGQSFIRNISKIYWLLLLLDWIVGIATQGDKRQKYSDRMAGVVVVQTSQPFASANQPPPPPPPPGQ
jgi:uncharacterized RDD family membrane protein YckC